MPTASAEHAAEATTSAARLGTTAHRSLLLIVIKIACRNAFIHGYSMKSKASMRLAHLSLVLAGLLAISPRLALGEDNLQDQLVRAASAGDEVKVKDLLARGANVNTPSSGKFGSTPLMHAAQNGHKTIAKLLLERGVDLKSGDSQTALSWSASRGHFEIATMLLERGVDRRIALVQNCSEGNLKALNFLLDEKAILDVEDANGETPLMAAASSARTEAVRLLLTKKADVNYRNKDYGLTALMYAVNPRGKLETVELLVEHGADVNSKSKEKWTPLMMAAANAQSDMVKLLLARQADAKVKNEQGQTALDLALKEGNKEIADLLRR
jgi:ankyrin repeat protein